MMYKKVISLFLAACCSTMTGAKAKTPPVADITVTGDWQIQIEYAGKTAVFEISPVETVQVENEIIEKLPVFNPNTAGYACGTALKGVKAQECSVTGALIPNSLLVKGKDSAKPFVRGKDYELNEEWGTVGRLEGGDIGTDTPVSVDYAYGLMRLDEITVKKGKFTLHRGTSHVANPGFSLSVSKENPVIARIWVTPRTKRLSGENLYPVLERNYPEPAKAKPSKAGRQLPETAAKLKAGGKIRIMAWGDSVTDGSYLPDSGERWQERIIAWLRLRYPEAEIELVTEAWGGRNTDSYRKEPPGSIHNYREKVLDARPDLIISEFVNDAFLDEQGVFEKYGRILSEFREIGAEWIILTPHYVRPDWMGLDREKDIDDDPRPYVKALRKFAGENSIALADASLRWGRLWRQGIPYPILMKNNINHPDAFGQGLFVDALKELFILDFITGAPGKKGRK